MKSLKEIGLVEQDWIFERENNPRIFDGYQIKNFYSHQHLSKKLGEYSRGTFFLEDKEVYRAWGIKKDPHCSYHAYPIENGFTPIYDGCPCVSIIKQEGNSAILSIDERDFKKEYMLTLVPQLFTYQTSGLTCVRCEEKIRELLLVDKNIAAVSFEDGRKTIVVEAYIDPTAPRLQALLEGTKYGISTPIAEGKNFLTPLKKFAPLIILLSLVLLFTFGHQYFYGFTAHVFMQYFMAGFFLLFGGLKVVNWKKFVPSYQAYDVVAQKSMIYAWLYPALEFGLGILYYIGVALFYVNICVFLLMLEKAYSVYKKLQSGQKVQCACLGGFFNIPITYVTLAEDLLMAGMALWMLF